MLPNWKEDGLESWLTMRFPDDQIEVPPRLLEVSVLNLLNYKKEVHDTVG